MPDGTARWMKGTITMRREHANSLSAVAFAAASAEPCFLGGIDCLARSKLCAAGALWTIDTVRADGSPEAQLVRCTRFLWCGGEDGKRTT